MQPDSYTRIAATIAEVAATADFYPGVVIVHNLRTQCVEYMSRPGLQLLRTTLAELIAMGPEYHSRFFNQQESAEYVPKIMALLEQNDLNQIVTFFQQVRTTQSPDWSWYMSSIRILLRGDDGLPLLGLCFACPIDPTSSVSIKATRLLEENNFLRKNHSKFGQLTKRECEVLRYLALGRSAPEISQTLFISVQTAETHRRNIKQKLNLESGYDLVQYAQAFDLI
ncbi:response regulator transcription factor [Hymenobacter cellulosivorans]|uniref:LuxR C-terminal-related transcriptional regulator n=1 Tax=Hymenobacter cellulosivorans TaxID=2932249 RepID=A0ABY4F7S2_9BACT|nr:LuxR C-terminal-related transcriptional regulator [Hymenobacter cellulosivorans]UOQ52620.1 LuxR C-terminal-related transcriptional regulator [Hymenobacter cellulosivorans]